VDNDYDLFELSYYFGYSQETNNLALNTCDTVTIPLSVDDSFNVLPDTVQHRILGVVLIISGIDASRDPSMPHDKVLQ